MQCAIYTRVSTDNQAEVEFNSCEAQEEKIRSFINSQENMEVFKVYSDAGFTGANLSRPALSEMLNDIKQNKIGLVISYKIDRLTRSPKDFYQLIELFEKRGVDFISVTERFDTSTPSGRLLRNIMLTFAQFERELASERTKDKMLQRAQKGMWNGGIVPFGYKSENKKLIINEKEAQIVRDIFETYVTSNSTSKIYDEMKDKDIRNREGQHFSKSAIPHILRNPVYTGKIKYAGKFSQGVHQPIISGDMFDLAQEIHKKRIRTLRVYKNYPLAGLVKCKECDLHMTPCHTNKRRQGKLKRYYYYRCTNTLQRDWDSCGTKQVSADRLEDYVFQNLERISLDKHYIESSIFRANNTPSGDRLGLPDIKSGQAPYGSKYPMKSVSPGHREGLELSEVCSESAKIYPDIFSQTLQLFVKGISERKGIEKNLWAKKFIKNIIYSKSDIQINLYYSSDFGVLKNSVLPNGVVSPPYDIVHKTGK